MPIYTYKCKKCGEIFDFLSGVGKGSEIPVCPKCKSRTVEKMFATFGVKMGASTSASTCATGTCPLSKND
jgi:putative FmdB family regulatory protein